MKNNHLHITELALTLLALFCAGCASDNVHMPEPDLTPAPQQFEGTVSSGIPVFPNFGPVVSQNYAILTWLNEEQSAITVELGPFHVSVGEIMQMEIEIGTMLIQNVPCQRIGEGNYEFEIEEFACQAGEYYTTGSMAGTLKNGTLDFTVHYHPGSMPFEVETRFLSDTDL